MQFFTDAVKKEIISFNFTTKTFEEFFLLKLVKPEQDSDHMRLLIQKSATYRQNEAIQPFPGITEFQPPLLYSVHYMYDHSFSNV